MTIWNVNTEAALRNAISRSAAGDTIKVRAGDYHIAMQPGGRFDIGITKSLNIVGDGGRANFYSDGHAVEKGIFSLVLGKTETVSFNNIGFFNAHNGASNGAGIRQNGGNLNVNNSYFENSQNGILSITKNENIRGDVHVTNSEFNLAGEYGYSHAMYVLADDFIVEGSNIHDTVRGHHIKSVSANTVVRNNILNDGNGTSSYAIDIGAGGSALIEDNTIIQGPNGDNPHIIMYASNRFGGQPGEVIIRDNVFKDVSGTTTGRVLKNTTDAEVQFYNNTVDGISRGKLFVGPFNQHDNVLNGAPLASYSANLGAKMGTAGNDTLYSPTSGVKSIDAAAGNDVIYGSDLNDMIFAGPGNDFVYGDNQKDQIFGNAGRDILLGGEDEDSIFGGGGNDIIFDNRDKNILWGGDGHDLVYGARTNEIDGNAGDDVVVNTGIGTSGGRLSGGPGNDILFGREGDDVIHGGDGMDIAVYAGNFSDYRVYKQYDTRYVQNIVASDMASDTGKTSETIDAIEKLQFANGYYDVSAQTFHSGVFLFNFQNFMNSIAILDNLDAGEIAAAPLDVVQMLQQVYSSLFTQLWP